MIHLFEIKSYKGGLWSLDDELGNPRGIANYCCQILKTRIARKMGVKKSGNTRLSKVRNSSRLPHQSDCGNKRKIKLERRDSR